MQRGTFVEIEHTADLGLELEGPSPDSILEAAQRGLTQLLFSELSGLEAETEREIAIAATGYPDLLKVWCERLYRLLEEEGFVALTSRVRVAVAAGEGGDPVGDENRAPVVGCRAVVEGALPPAERIAQAGELKAVTYHQLAFAPCLPAGPGPPRWRARVIFDV
ncbi:MAG TPA: archease [Gemmatimonadota bacterium]|nr:archease [Gemmatimonadota bacterium]